MVHILFIFVFSIRQNLREKLLLLTLAIDYFLLQLSNFHFVVVHERRRKINLDEILEIIQGLTIRGKELVYSVMQIVEELIVQGQFVELFC